MGNWLGYDSSTTSILEDMPSYDFISRVLVIGYKTVGKSSLLKRIDGQNFTLEYNQTTKIDFITLDKKIDDKKFKLLMWDSAGADHYFAISKAFYKYYTCIVLVYDVSNKKSFDKCQQYLKDFKPYEQSNNFPPKLLVGNKADRGEKYRKVSYEQG